MKVKFRVIFAAFLQPKACKLITKEQVLTCHIPSKQPKIKHLNFPVSETENNVNIQLISKFKSFIISLHMPACGVSLPSINNTY
jgi:phage FluMu protein Com